MDKTQVESLFRYAHLLEHLQAVSKPFYDLDLTIFAELLSSAEYTLALRSL